MTCKVKDCARDGRKNFHELCFQCYDKLCKYLDEVFGTNRSVFNVKTKIKESFMEDIVDKLPEIDLDKEMRDFIELNKEN